MIALAGGYGGVDRELWQARGWVRPDGNGSLRSQRGAEAELSILAQRFRLSSIEPILKDTPIIDAEQTEVDASLIRSSPSAPSTFPALFTWLGFRFTRRAFLRSQCATWVLMLRLAGALT